jgi:hypothetical protein
MSTNDSPLRPSKFESQVSKQIQQLLFPLCKDVMVVPYFKVYKPDGHYWEASSKPMKLENAYDWLVTNVTKEHTTSKSWVKEPEVGLVTSRGYIDYLLKNPGLPKDTLFQ